MVNHMVSGNLIYVPEQQPSTRSCGLCFAALGVGGYLSS